MITRIFYSKSPANTINYVMNPKKQAEIEELEAKLKALRGE